MTEDQARQVLLLQQVETGPSTPAWNTDDAAWATRLARETAGADAAPDRYVADRAGHAMQRLLPRDAGLRRRLARRTWHPAAVPLALVIAFIAGLGIDQVGASQRINLLAPPVWGLVAWNLGVYVLLPLPLGGVRRRIAGAVGALPSGLPLTLARVAVLLHLAALALALGVVSGMYLRGLVLEHRAGWESTFLGAATVQRLLDTALAPASRLTAIAVPDVAPLRTVPGSAAPWIHLYAATLLLAVVLPRALLAAAAAWTAAALRRRFPLPLTGAYFDRLLLARRGGRMRVLVLPHGSAPAAPAGLQALFAAAIGSDVALHIGAVTAYGDEDAAPPDAAGADLHVALVDLTATPEAEAHGRFVARLPAPRLVVADEAAFRRRFDAQRLAQRRAAWQALADAHAAPLVCADLDHVAPDDSARLRAVLAR